MFTSKQRSVLRSLAQTVEPIGQIGKGGISDNMIEGLSDALEKRELIKITVLNNSEEEAKEKPEGEGEEEDNEGENEGDGEGDEV